MKDAGIKDTAAFRVIREMVTHSWSADEEINDEDVISICQNFSKLGGSWQAIMDGDPRSVTALENIIDGIIELRRLSRIALRIVETG